MAEVFAGILGDIWFFGPVSFVVGMGVVCNGDKAGKMFKKGTETMYKNAILNGKYQIPQLIQGTLDMSEWNMACSLSKMLLKFSFRFCSLYLLAVHSGLVELEILPKMQLVIWNLMAYYSYRIYSYGAFAVFFHEDISFWSQAKRRTYLLLPFDILTRQKLANNLTMQESVANFDLIKEPLMRSAQQVLLFGVAVLIGFSVLPPPAHLLLAPACLGFWNNLLIFLDQLYHAFNLVAFQNRFEPVVGDASIIFEKGEGYENFGRQYNYMRKLNTPLQDYSKSLVYSKYKAKFGLGGGKAATVVMRGALVLGTLLSFGLADAQAASMMSLYYAAHAAFMYWNHSQPDHFDSDFPRLLATAAEGVVGAYLWYQPMINSILSAE